MWPLSKKVDVSRGSLGVAFDVPTPLLPRYGALTNYSVVHSERVIADTAYRDFMIMRQQAGAYLTLTYDTENFEEALLYIRPDDVLVYEKMMNFYEALTRFGRVIGVPDPDDDWHLGERRAKRAGCIAVGLTRQSGIDRVDVFGDDRETLPIHVIELARDPIEMASLRDAPAHVRSVETNFPIRLAYGLEEMATSSWREGTWYVSDAGPAALVTLRVADRNHLKMLAWSNGYVGES